MYRNANMYESKIYLYKHTQIYNHRSISTIIAKHRKKHLNRNMIWHTQGNKLDKTHTNMMKNKKTYTNIQRQNIIGKAFKEKREHKYKKSQSRLCKDTLKQINSKLGSKAKK